MNVRLRKEFVFPAAIVYNNRFRINNYTLVLDLLTMSEDPYAHNVAYERVHYWINEVITDSILLREGAEGADSFKATIARVIELPEDPVDQVINIMLFTKINAILEDRVRVTDIELSSAFGDDITYLHCEEEQSNLELPAWCSDPRPNWGAKKSSKAVKVVSLDRAQEIKWKDLGLSWEPEENEDHSIVVSFTKDDSK